jgi:uncharacterized protein YybS (DUF2232 family)
VKNPLKIQVALFEMMLLVIFIGAISLLVQYLPLLMVVTWFYPMLFFIYTYRQNWKMGLYAVVLTTFVVFLLSTMTWLSLLTVAGPLGVAMAYGLKTFKKPLYALGIGCAVILIGAALWYTTMSSLLIEGDLLEVLTQEVSQMTFPEEFMNALGEVQVEGVYSLEAQAKQVFLMMLPAVVLTLLSAYVVLNYAFGHWLLIKMKMRVVPMVSFDKFSLPQNIIMGTTIILVGTLIVGQLSSGLGFNLMINVMYMILLIFSVQGLAVGTFVLGKYRVFWFLKLPALVAMTLFLQLFGLAVVGWLDLVFDLRKIRVKL